MMKKRKTLETSEKIGKSYLPKMKNCILTFLYRRFDEEEAQRIYHKIEQIDEKYRKEEPYIGDKDNMMAHNLYQSFCMFALYEAMERELSAEDINELVDIYFEQTMARMPKNLNMDKLIRSKLLRNLIYKFIGAYAVKANAKKGNVWGNTWGIKINPYNKKTGLAMNLVGCPLADFAKKHDMMDILPVLCNIDHRTAEAFGLKLFRNKTVSNGDAECVYWIVSNQSKQAKQFVNEENEAGLILSKRAPGH